MKRSGAFVAILFWTLATLTPSSGSERGVQESAQDQALVAASARVRETVVFDGIEFVEIPPGEFLMGSTSPHASKGEQPVTRVRISRGFYLGKYEVTQEQWQAVMGSNPSWFSGCDRCPVETVSWDAVQEFIEKLNMKSGGGHYRLPTEAEWEYAARAETTTDTYAGDLTEPFGNDPVVSAIAWYRANSGQRTHPVGQKTSNRFGLHDMLGNVLEWVGDWYGPYPGGAVTDPSGPESGWRGLGVRMARGSAWIYDAKWCRSSRRRSFFPVGSFGLVGFRLLRRLHEPAQDPVPAMASCRVRVGETVLFDGIEFVGIPPGDFLMGSTSLHAFDNEQPVTRVRISQGFYLGKYEVTQKQWQAVMGDNPSESPDCGRCPVDSVSWDDVQAFIGKLNARPGGGRYRLPTEAEWEYAARAGTITDTYAGDIDNQSGNDPVMNGIAWYFENSGSGSHPVGEKAANGFGLHDMTGNVSEWVEDWYGPYPGGVGDWFGPYPGGGVTDPSGPGSGTERVSRGGTWGSEARWCRSALREKSSPGSRNYRVGFRLLRME